MGLLVAAHLYESEPLAAAALAVFDYLGALHCAEGGKQRFDKVHTFGTEQIALAANAHGARLVHVSAIGADENSAAAYARSKAAAEKLALTAQPQAIVMRPSILFGPEDDFFNRFAALARMSPMLPLVGGGETKFQPVFVGDVAAAIADAVDGKLRAGTIYELGGPEVRTFKELMQFVLTTIERKRLLVALPFFAAKMQAMLLQFAPPPLTLTSDQVEMLRVDNVVSEAAKAEGRTLQGIGIAPASFEAIVPSYLWRFRRAGQFRSRAA